MEETAYRGTSLPLLLTKYCLGHQIKKNDMGGAYSTYGAWIEGFGGKA